MTASSLLDVQAELAEIGFLSCQATRGYQFDQFALQVDGRWASLTTPCDNVDVDPLLPISGGPGLWKTIRDDNGLHRRFDVSLEAETDGSSTTAWACVRGNSGASERMARQRQSGDRGTTAVFGRVSSGRRSHRRDHPRQLRCSVDADGHDRRGGSGRGHEYRGRQMVATECALDPPFGDGFLGTPRTTKTQVC